MEKRTKKILLTSASILLILGGVFWLWRRNKPKEDETTDGNTNLGSGTPSYQPSSDVPSDVLAFQKFANSKGYSPKLVEDGIWGSKTSAAWKVWGKEYNKLSPSTTIAPKSSAQKKVTSSYFTDPSKMVGKNVYSNSSVTSLYNTVLNRVGTAKKDEFLGAVTKVERTSTGDYILTVVSPLKNVYKVFAGSVYFLI